LANGFGEAIDANNFRVGGQAAGQLQPSLGSVVRDVVTSIISRTIFMTLDGFLTFLTVILAALAITPSVVKLRLMLHLRALAFASFVCFLLVIYFEFYATLAQPCVLHSTRICDWLALSETSKVTPSQWAFVVVLAWLIIAVVTMLRSSLPWSGLPALSALVEDLAYERRWSELLPLVEPALQTLHKAASRKLPIMRLHDFVEGLDDSRATIEKMLDRLRSGEPDHPSWYEPYLRRPKKIAAKFARFMPAGEKIERAAKEVVRVVYLNPNLLEYIAEYRPEFGVAMLKYDARTVHDFFGPFMTALIRSPQSLLYAEVQQNQNLAYQGYAYPEHNRLLHFLFSPCKNAERLAAYKPLGDYFIAKVRPQEVDYVRYLNGPADMYSNDECWRDSSFVIVQFFDLMVTAAVWEGIRWHMWLYYYPHFMESLVSIYDSADPDLDESAEFPTRASYLIYEIVQNLLGWISVVTSLPDSSPHKTMKQADTNHENDNIPKSAALALGTCLSHLLTAENVQARVRSSVHDNVMSKLRDLQGPGSADIRTVLISSIIRRGPLGPSLAYGRRLKAYFENTDHVVRFELPDYAAALHDEYGA
jgi:hypothetical protein